MSLIKLVNGQPVEMTPEEEAAFETSRTPTLAQAKRTAREAIAARLAKAERNGFAFQAVRVASDADMLSRIAILAERARRAAADGETITVRLVAEDDSALNLNRSEMLDLAKASGDHFIACSANARTLRQAVAAATTLAEVRAIDIGVGWPE